MRIRIALACLVLAGCRIGFDELDHEDDFDDGVGEPAAEAPDASTGAGACPQGYVEAGTSCYRVSLIRANTWLDAELACEADGVGAHLATISDPAESALFASLVQAANVNDTWVGVTDRLVEGMYRNVTGDLAAYLVWATDEPSTSDCVQSDGVEFHASQCDSSDEFVCEVDGIPPAAAF
jgi:hypothetical protein